tara:strand:- start:905 stop:1306 length:402 start_codon:yes stop_codon:yes gene_type:complete
MSRKNNRKDNHKGKEDENRDPADEFADVISQSGIDDPGDPDPDPEFTNLATSISPISYKDLSKSANTASSDYNWRKSPSLEENEFIPVDHNKYPILKYKRSGGKKRKTNKKSRKSKKSRKVGKQTKKHRKSKK